MADYMVDPDGAILSNIIFSVLAGGAIFIAFVIIRPWFKEVYYPNVLNQHQ